MYLDYVDNGNICSKNNHQHIKGIDKVLTSLHQAEVTLKSPKFYLFQKKIEYTDHILMPGRIAAVSKKR